MICCVSRYGVKHMRVLGTTSRVVVQDCIEAEDNIDARDKFFMCVDRKTQQGSNWLHLIVFMKGCCAGI